jgi:hypothetical protein
MHVNSTLNTFAVRFEGIGKQTPIAAECGTSIVIDLPSATCKRQP